MNDKATNIPEWDGENMNIFEVPPNWIKVKTYYCVACGVGKYDKGKGECFVYGKIVNGGRHQYDAYEPPERELQKLKE